MNTPPYQPEQPSRPAAPSLYGAAVEYAIHCLVWLVTPREHPASSRDLAQLQGISPAMLAKIMPKLERVGIVAASGGVHGGYRLARAPADITILDIIDAVDGGKRLFDCKEIRQNCVLFGGQAPAWSGAGTCGIHAVMLRAEKTMRAELARTTLEDLGRAYKAPGAFFVEVGQWLDGRVGEREQARLKGMRRGGRRQHRNDAIAGE